MLKPECPATPGRLSMQEHSQCQSCCSCAHQAGCFCEEAVWTALCCA